MNEMIDKVMRKNESLLFNSYILFINYVFIYTWCYGIILFVPLNQIFLQFIWENKPPGTDYVWFWKLSWVVPSFLSFVELLLIINLFIPPLHTNYRNILKYL